MLPVRLTDATPRRRAPARSALRRGRACVLWGLAGFLALQLGLALGVKLWWPQLHDPEYGAVAVRLQRRLAATPPPRRTVLMLGSSRTYHAFMAGKVEQSLASEGASPLIVFNCGIPGSGPVTELVTLQRLLNDGVQPDLVLIEVTPVLLAESQKKPLEARSFSLQRAYLKELPMLYRYRFIQRDTDPTVWQCWLAPWYRYRVNIFNHVEPRLLPAELRWDWIPRPDASGWRASTVDARFSDRKPLWTDASYKIFGRYLAHFHMSPHAKRALHELMATCRDRNIRTALVLMPEGGDFRGWYGAGVEQQLQALLNELAQEYGSPIVDARDWVSDEHFVDPNHLAVSGAEVFTERFGREVVGPLVHQLDAPGDSRSGDQMVQLPVRSRSRGRSATDPSGPPTN